MHFEEGKGIMYVIPEVICQIFLISFILLFYFKDKFYLDKPFIFAMILYSIFWQIFSFLGDMKIAKNRFGITGKELSFFVVISILFVSPCFIFAFLLLK